MSEKEETFTVSFYEPGSPEDLARREREIASALSTVIFRIERSIYTKETIPYSVLDVKAGEYPFNSRERYRLYSRDHAEYSQLIWASALAALTREALATFQRVYGRYPERASELFNFVGEPNESAWVAPLTGKSVGLTDKWNGEDFFYRSNEDNSGYEYRIPLFGAGIGEPNDVKAREWNRFLLPGSGYIPGDSLQVARNMPDVEHAFVISPW